MTCSGCGHAVSPGDNFCENCGLNLHTPACTACGAAATDDSGFCPDCGTRLPQGRDHLETELEPGGAAGVTDLGLRRRRNEDAMALGAAGGLTVAVVCDGVATSPRADEAAQAAADLAVERLLADLGGGADAKEATVRACAAAASAVAAMGTVEDAPACTYVSAVVAPGEITVGWLGDSRAYWLPEGGPGRLLTTDDVASHGVISSWLGADAEPEDAHVLSFSPDLPGLLLACTDGLWEYLTGDFPAAGTPLERARLLLRHALDSGGRDNVTIVLIPGGPV
ncbi:protein phosphatase 2C domain-containing protein [Nonomuraea sp. NPDC050328]|uniref:protein phosphatase 2C domain-containing protein n=1 Tax=Nonomuraea sp. NPDC050328 TaxID=3364361 RepID=UPI0037A23489